MTWLGSLFGTSQTPCDRTCGAKNVRRLVVRALRSCPVPLSSRYLSQPWIRDWFLGPVPMTQVQNAFSWIHLCLHQKINPVPADRRSRSS